MQMLNKPFMYLAPLEGCTEIEFRNVFARHFKGIDAAMAPFVSLMHHDSDEKRRSWDVPKASEQAMPTIPQFMGRNIKDFNHLYAWIKYMGYEELNWNLGCPSKRVVRRGRGCGTLKFPDEIRFFLDGVFNHPDIQFSIKTRLGLDHPDESFNLFEIYNQYPIKEIILHPRIGKQMYRGEVMHSYFLECLKLSKNKIVYNGDINTVEDFEKVSKMYPSVDKFMIGRGLVKDPFLVEKIRGLIPVDAGLDKERFLTFHDELYSDFEAKFRDQSELLGKMKDYWRYFSHQFENRNEVFKTVARSINIAEFKKNTNRLINELIH